MIESFLFVVACVFVALVFVPLYKSIRAKIRNYRARNPKHIYPGDPGWEKYLDDFEKRSKGSVSTPDKCPFCGCAFMECCDGKDLDGNSIYYEFCTVCGASGPTADIETDATFKWNRRFYE